MEPQVIGVTESARSAELIARMERLPWTRKHTGVFATLVSGTFFDGYDVVMIGSALPIVSAALHLSLAQAGVLVSGGNVGAAIGSFVAGTTADRIGRRTVFLLACAIMGAFAIVATLQGSIHDLYLARLFQGIGYGAEVPIAGALINEFVPHRGRGFTVLVYESAFAWGGVAAPILAQIAIHTTSTAAAWKIMFGFGGLSLWVLFAWVRLLPESPRWFLLRNQPDKADAVVQQFEGSARKAGKELADPSPEPAPQTAKTNLFELFSPFYIKRTITNWIMWIAAYSYAYGMSILLTELYVSVGGLPIGDALYLTLANGVLQSLLYYACGKIFLRYGRKRPVFLGLLWAGLILLLGAIVWGFVGARNWETLFIFSIVAMIGIVPSSCGGYAYTPEQFPTRMRAWALASCTTWVRGTSAIMPIIITAIATSSLGLAGVWWISAIPLLIGGLWVWRFGLETKDKVLEEIAP